MGRGEDDRDRDRRSSRRSKRSRSRSSDGRKGELRSVLLKNAELQSKIEALESMLERRGGGGKGGNARVQALESKLEEVHGDCAGMDAWLSKVVKYHRRADESKKDLARAEEKLASYLDDERDGPDEGDRGLNGGDDNADANDGGDKVEQEERGRWESAGFVGDP